MVKRIACLVFAAALAFSCGVTRKVVVETKPETVRIPTQAEADSIMGLPGAAVFVVEKKTGPVIYAFKAHPDSAFMDVHCRTLSQKIWKESPVVTFPCGNDLHLPLVAGPDSARVRQIAGKSYLTSICTRKAGDNLQETVYLYDPDTEVMNDVSFEGKRRRDGKIYGQTNLSMKADPTLPQLVWADSLLARTPGFVILSKEQLMSDQAIEWWTGKNPAALTKATKIYFGSLPEECTLVKQYAKTAKETGNSHRVALFDTVEYTVIVAQNRSTGKYSLIWAEPKCRNKKTDMLLNSVSFAKNGRLELFYYKGNRFFKYYLSLANGQLQR